MLVRRPRMRTADGRHGRNYRCRPTSCLAPPRSWAGWRWEKTLAGISTRRYPVGLEPVAQRTERAATATSKSAILRRFVAATETALSELLGSGGSRAQTQDRVFCHGISELVCGRPAGQRQRVHVAAGEHDGHQASALPGALAQQRGQSDRPRRLGAVGTRAAPRRLTASAAGSGSRQAAPSTNVAARSVVSRRPASNERA